MLNTDIFDEECSKRICRECEYYRKDGNCIVEWALQQGRMESILHQCNHDLAVKEAYQQGKTDATKELKEKYLDADAYNEGLVDGRTDAIDEIVPIAEEIKKLSEGYGHYDFLMKIHKLADGLLQLKEQKNELV